MRVYDISYCFSEIKSASTVSVTLVYNYSQSSEFLWQLLTVGGYSRS